MKKGRSVEAAGFVRHLESEFQGELNVARATAAEERVATADIGRCRDREEAVPHAIVSPLNAASTT